MKCIVTLLLILFCTTGQAQRMPTEKLAKLLKQQDSLNIELMYLKVFHPEDTKEKEWLENNLDLTKRLMDIAWDEWKKSVRDTGKWIPLPRRDTRSCWDMSSPVWTYDLEEPAVFYRDELGIYRRIDLTEQEIRKLSKKIVF